MSDFEQGARRVYDQAAALYARILAAEQLLVLAPPRAGVKGELARLCRETVRETVTCPQDAPSKPAAP